MLSVRQDGASVSEIVGKYLGENARKLMVAFSIVLLVLVGVVFVKSPADILHNLTGIPTMILLGIIIIDRKSTRLNSSHANISYAVFCLKKKKKIHTL